MRGALHVDGAEVDPGFLSALVDQVCFAAERAGAGADAGIEVPHRDGLPVVVATLAAERLGAVLVLGGPTSGRPGASIPAAARVVPSPEGCAVVPMAATPAGPRAGRQDGGYCFFTSGSEGEAKAVLLGATAIRYQRTATRERLGFDDGDALLLPLPAIHAYGFSVLQQWVAGGPALHLESRFGTALVAERMRRHMITCLDGVPSMYRALLARAGHDPELRAALGRLRVRGCGGDILATRLQAEFTDVVGGPIHDGYGLTEAGPNVALNAPGDFAPGTVGRPLDGTELRAGPGGEILVRSPSVMTGYLGAPEATEAAFLDGWLRTGDTGSVLPSGRLVVTGRIREAVIVHGRTHAPADLEEALTAQPAIAEAAVVGVPGTGDRGDQTVAFLVMSPQRPGRDLAALAVAACRAALPPELRPRRIHHVDALPRLPSGKLDRRAIRALAGTHTTTADPRP
ncbi:hypothetical protein DQ384_15405 [Sphaerisporangium album]|uniref:Long-chain fatty acid--CoA ligase n=1 Tax=Sphaerisporangium album TaxID=509200 RepID=A0A367FK40_9ACTN|nr:AMP-binding protein [Sphaerisporangium album]RCG30664.1 hypothetical protein DQ384_15405 [Sphaerisporangium album]